MIGLERAGLGVFKKFPGIEGAMCVLSIFLGLGPGFEMIGSKGGINSVTTSSSLASSTIWSLSSG